MVNFIIIIILIALVIFIAFKMKNLKTKIVFILIFLAVSFILLTGYLVFSGKEINLSNIQGISSAAKIYIAWLGHAGSNIIKISSYAFNQEWKPDNITNSTG